jgi:tRNA(Ile2) C34 agmatinyltransferase TiaS
MTAGVLDRPSFMPDRPALDGSGTLEELLSSALGEARANGSTECPVCRARMISTRAREAQCGGCGSRLS